MKKIFALLLTTAFLLATLTGCANTTGKLDSIKNSGKLVVYTDPNFPPFEFMSGEDVKGVDMELARAIADELGVTLEIQQGEFDSIILAVKGGKGDIAISGFTITDERKKSIDFSAEYINSVQYLILPTDSPIKHMEDLSGKKIAVAKGYTGSLIIDDEINTGVLKDTGATFTEYPSAMEAAIDLKNNKVAAVVMDEYVAKSVAAKNADTLFTIPLVYRDGTSVEEAYGVVVPKGNEDLLTVINKVIAQAKEQDKIQSWMLQHTE